jgi:hypothetical protein
MDLDNLIEQQGQPADTNAFVETYAINRSLHGASVPLIDIGTLCSNLFK